MPNKDDKITRNKIARSAGVVSIAVMCSRVLGLIREQVFAFLFGAGYAYDAFVVAFRIPNLLRDLFAEGALSAAFVTVFTDYQTKRSAEETRQLACNILVFFSLLLSLIVLIGIYLAGPLVNLLAPDFNNIAGKTTLTVTLTRIMFPFLIFIALAAVVMAILNTKGKFFIPALSSCFFNLGSVIGGTSLAILLPHWDIPAIIGMAWGTLLGGLLQLLIQLPSLSATGFHFNFQLRLFDPGLKRVLLLMLPATIGLSATQINIFINTNFAASCMEGAVSWLNYAFRLVQLPIGIFGVAISIAVMPILAKQAAEQDFNALKKTFSSSMITVFALTIPATVGLIVLAEPIIRLIFEHGSFTSADTQRTAFALTYYAYGIFAYAAVKVTVPPFYALKSTRYPVIGSFIAVAANILFITLTLEHLGYQAIALSTSCTMALNFLFLQIVLYHKLNGFPLQPLGIGLLKIVVAGTGMLLIIYPLRLFLTIPLSGSLLAQISSVLLLVISGIITYALLLQRLDLQEFRAITEKLTQRFAKS